MIWWAVIVVVWVAIGYILASLSGIPANKPNWILILIWPFVLVYGIFKQVWNRNR